MIIERERFNSLTEEEIKALCSKFNREISKKFTIKDDDTFCIGSGVKIPLGMFNYKNDILTGLLEQYNRINTFLIEDKNGEIIIYNRKFAKKKSPNPLFEI